MAVAIGYRYQRLPGTVVALVAMILPVFPLALVLTIAYTLVPAALAIVVVSAYRLGQEFLSPSVELALIPAAVVSVLVLGINPAVMRRRGPAQDLIPIASADRSGFQEAPGH